MEEGRTRKPEWGARRVILNDLGPAATFISAGYNLPFDVKAFAHEAERILDEVDRELGWMYETRHKDGRVRPNQLHRLERGIQLSGVQRAKSCFSKQALDREDETVKEDVSCAKRAERL